MNGLSQPEDIPTREPRYIETFERRGYRFLAAVETIAAAADTQLRQLEVVRKHIDPDVALVELAGNIVYGPECHQIEWLTAELLEEGMKKIIFDLSSVGHLGSSGVGIIVMCSGKVKQMRESYALRAPRDTSGTFSGLRVKL
jgi:anti-anti-sigma regulatory factor